MADSLGDDEVVAENPPGQTAATLVPCFVCGKELEAVSVLSPMQPYGGLICTASGNYGSRIHDPAFPEDQRLMFLICDDCFKAGRERVRRMQTERRRPKIEYVDWKP